MRALCSKLYFYLARQPEPEPFSSSPFSISPSPILCISLSPFLAPHLIKNHAIACCLIQLNGGWLCCRANLTKSDHPELGRRWDKKYVLIFYLSAVLWRLVVLIYLQASGVYVYKALRKITSHCIVSNANPSSHKPRPVRISAEDRASSKIINAWAYVLSPLEFFTSNASMSSPNIPF